MASTRRGALAAAASFVALGGCAGRSVPADTAQSGGDARIGLAGDVMLGRSVHERHHDEPPGSVWGPMLPRLRALDGLVANLECCISARGERWPGKAYYFRAGPDWALPALDAAGMACVSLANNHALDFGVPALLDTLDGLDRTGIAAAGAGRDRQAALEPVTTEVGGLTVGMLALTDRKPEFAATADRPGTAIATPTVRDRRTRRLVRRQLDRLAGADVVVASLHWGPNWELVKRPPLRQFARWLVDSGVDVVHGHSAHVPQGIEVYEGAPVLYDCGDLVDDYIVKEDLHNDRSFLYELVIEDGAVAAVRLHPVELDVGVDTASPAAARWLRGRVRALSARFGTTIRSEPGSPTLRVPVAE
jgi:poly-gamma-glutamate capsule biosynthesis protein CapA/YwtB (metallophosphatase superfamily)